MPIRRQCFVLALLALTGCGTTSEPTDGLLVTITVAPLAVSGAGASVTVSLVNRSHDPVAVGGSSSCRFAFDILDAAGRAVSGYAPTACTRDMRTVTLAPGARDEVGFTWAAADDVTGRPLPNGRYLARGSSLWLGGRSSAIVPFRIERGQLP